MKKKVAAASGLYYRGKPDSLVSAYSRTIEWLSTDEYEPAETGVYPVLCHGRHRVLAAWDQYHRWDYPDITHFLPVRLPAPPARKCHKPVFCQKDAGHEGDCES